MTTESNRIEYKREPAGDLEKEAAAFPDAGGGDCAGILKNARHKAAGLLFPQFLTEETPRIHLI